MDEEKMCRLLEVLETRKLITGYDSEYILEKISYSEWCDFLRKKVNSNECEKNPN